MSWGFGFGNGRTCERPAAAPASSLIAAQHLTPITEENADVLEVLIGQVAKDRKINAVLGKALRVLGHAELFEPVRNLLHCAAPSATVVTALRREDIRPDALT